MKGAHRRRCRLEGAASVFLRVNVGRWVAPVAAVVLLNASLTFYNVWPTPMIRWQSHLSIELAACVLLLAVWARRAGSVSSLRLRVLAIAWVLLVVGRYADVTAPALYGRDINLFWDARHMSAVVAMLAFSASSGVLLAGVLAALVALVALYAAARWALGAASEALCHSLPASTLLSSTSPARHGPGRALVWASATCVAMFAAQQAGVLTSSVPVFARPVLQAFVRQARVLATQIGARANPMVASRPPTESDLADVDGADVYLVFVESYGAVTFDRPEFRAALAPARAGLQADVRHAGRHVVSAFVDSPTFGGSSWLAHVTLMTGVEARDEDTNVALMAQERDTLVTTFARRGYRTIALMPGLQRDWPEGAFYRFDRIYDERTLDYRGPSFGWWTVPDQFALARLDSLEAAAPRAGAAVPRFVFFPTTSTHAPFTPIAPYQPDWQRLLTVDPYDAADIDRAWNSPPDYLNLSPAYLNAVTYAYASIGGYVRQHANRDLIMIVLGDHQPAAAVSGEAATWEVPVHVIASRPEVLDTLRARGFVDGLTPDRPRVGPMHGLLPILLDAFGNPAPAAREVSRNAPPRGLADASPPRRAALSSNREARR